MLKLVTAFFIDAAYGRTGNLHAEVGDTVPIELTNMDCSLLARNPLFPCKLYIPVAIWNIKYLRFGW